MAENRIETRRVCSESGKLRRLPIQLQLDGKDEARRNSAEEKKARKANRRADVAKLRERRDEEERGKFSRVLDRCLDVLKSTMNSGGDIFQFLDPLIGDTQCHMHAVLILDTLRKCHDLDDRPCYDIDKLDDEDKKLLGTAVLFTFLKASQTDEFGLIIREVSVRHFDSLFLSSKNSEAYYVSELRRYFNSRSVDSIISFGGDKFKGIFRSCEAKSEGLGLKYLPCYSGIHTVIEYLKARKLPIILSTVSIASRAMGEDTRYTLDSHDIRFYEYREDEDRYCRKVKLTDSERGLATVTFGCYSLITAETRGLPFEDFDVTDLLLMSAASHGQLPKNTMLSSGHEDWHDYVKRLYAQNVDVYDEFHHLYELGRKYDLIDARYCRVLPIANDQGTDRYFMIERRREGVRFAIDHIYLSNYSREYKRMVNVDLDCQVHESELYQMKMEQTAFQVLTYLGLLCKNV